MRNRIYWGLGVLILLIIGVTVFLVAKEKAEIRELKQDSEIAQKVLDGHNATKAPTDKVVKQPSEVNLSDETQRPPPPGKTFEGGGHWHDGEWHDKTHTEQPIDTAPTMTQTEINELNQLLKTHGLDVEKMTPKQQLYLRKVGVPFDILPSDQQKMIKDDFYEEHGLNPPPEGYEYDFVDLGVPRIDENGKAVIYKITDPTIKESFGGYLRENSNR